MERSRGERGQAVEARLAQLREELADGLEQARRGELIPAEEFRERIRQKSQLRFDDEIEEAE